MAKHINIPTIDEDELVRYIHANLFKMACDVPEGLIRQILDLELEYLKEKGIAKYGGIGGREMDNHVKIKKEENRYFIDINGQKIEKVIDFKLVVKPHETTLALTIDVDHLEADIH